MMFQFDSVADFLTMAGHGPFVWGAYGVSLLVMAWLVASPLLRIRGELALIRRQSAAARSRQAPGGDTQAR